jgi:hypothetical protein
MAATELMTGRGDEQRRRVRRSALLWIAIAAAFYFGYIVMTLVRAAR